MLTQCPECQTVFRVTPEQLGAAGGKVRCSRCHIVFNASDNHFQPAAETDTPEQAEASGSETAPEGAPSDTAATTAAAGDETPAIASTVGVRAVSHDDDADGEAEQGPGDEDLAAAEPEPENEQADTLDALDIAEGSAAAASSTLPLDTPADDVHSPLRQAEDNAATDETEPDSITEEATATEKDAQRAPAVSYGDDQPPGETAAEDITGEPPSQHPAEAEAEAEENDTPQALTEQPEPSPPTEAEPPATVEPGDEAWGEGAEAWWPAEEDEAKTATSLPGEAGSDELQAASPFEEEEEDSPTASPPEEALELFTDEEAATTGEGETPSAPPDEEALPDAEQGFADVPGVTADSNTETERESGTPGEADDQEFDDELFDLFAEEPDTDTTTGEAPASDSEATQGTGQTEEPQQCETGQNETASAATAGAEWAPFSEANIEALLTPSGESDELESITETGQQREVELSMDELDLSADDSAPPATSAPDEDEELLNQRLPEDDAYHELDLDDSEPATQTTPAEDEGRQSVEPDADEPPQYAAQESYSLPPQLEQQQPRSMRGIILWGSGILLLLASLVLQYLYYHRTALAENTSLRPLLSQMCEMTGCTLPPRRDLGKIRLADHLMQFHPRYKDSLLITATLVNRAEFSQPFPVVEVVMTDLQQKVIARRHFRPNEYLIGEPPPKGFVPDTEVPLMLEVVDPGETAVGFEFNFY